MDGDGYEDLLVGAEKADSSSDTDVGAAYLFSGGAGQWAGSYDAASYAMAIILGASAEDYLGMGVDGGDLDSDGHADLVLGAWGVDSSSDSAVGAIYVFNGPLSGTTDVSAADGTITGDTAESELGQCVLAADLNSDGQLDVLAPAYGSDELAVFFGGEM